MAMWLSINYFYYIKLASIYLCFCCGTQDIRIIVLRVHN